MVAPVLIIQLGRVDSYQIPNLLNDGVCVSVINGGLNQLAASELAEGCEQVAFGNVYQPGEVVIFLSLLQITFRQRIVLGFICTLGIRWE